MMNFLTETQLFRIKIPSASQKIFCKLFEDNAAGAIHLAKVLKDWTHQPEI